MARRIASAILLTLWVMLFTGGLVAYFCTKSLLLSDFDQTLVARALALPDLQSSPPASAAPQFSADRYVITNQRGETLGRFHGPATAPLTQVPPEVVSESFAFATLADGQQYRTATLHLLAKTGSDPAPLTLVYSSPTRQIDHILRSLAWALSISGLAAGVLATWVAIRVSRAALRPLRDAAEVIGGIDEAHLDRRIEATALPPELVPVGQRLNAMLERLDQSFAQRKQFLADASHELRTPIAALLTTMEVAARHPPAEAQIHDVLAGCLGDIRLLRQLVESLMQQARSENLSHDEPFENIDVRDILHEAIRVAEALAIRKKVAIACRGGDPLLVQTQPNRLRSIVRNLLSNAVEHNRDHGSVEITAAVNDKELNISIGDTGAGIAPGHLPHLFEPFYRADSVRGEEGSHLGLGLFLVQSHVRALGGSCDVQSELGVGSVFCIRIPLRKPSANCVANATPLVSSLIPAKAGNKFP